MCSFGAARRSMMATCTACCSPFKLPKRMHPTCTTRPQTLPDNLSRYFKSLGVSSGTHKPSQSKVPARLLPLLLFPRLVPQNMQACPGNLSKPILVS